MADPQVTRCEHVRETKAIGRSTFSEVLKTPCKLCVNEKYSGPNRWLCLSSGCQSVLCGTKNRSHCDVHFNDTNHPLQVNLKTLQVWCNTCDTQVSLLCNIPSWEMGKFLEDWKNRAAPKTDSPRRRSAVSQGSTESVKSPERTSSVSVDSAYASQEISNGNGEEKMPIASVGRKYQEKEAPTSYFGSAEPDEKFEETADGPRGLTGLGNLGNTCYANASLQALCNCVPLQEYFLGGLMDDRADIRPGLATAFRRLLSELWSPKRLSYVVPHGCLSAVRTFYPMFRGYSQHDSQEFIRCFLDQLHEELKQSVYEWEMSETELQLIENKGRLKDEKPVELGSCSRLSSKSSMLSMEQSTTDGSNYETADSGCSLDSGTGKKTPGKRKRRRRQRAKVEVTPVESSTSSSENEIARRTPVSSVVVAKRKPVKFRSIVSDVFDGKILSSVQCLSCKRISRTVETFQDLSVSIPTYEQVSLLRAAASQNLIASGDTSEGWISWFTSYLKGWFFSVSVTLEDCFAAFFSTDELKGDDMYSCDECKKLRNGAKHCELLELPEVLSVHLKRFKHEFMYSSKISTHVAFPLEGLDLKPFIHKDCHNKVTKYDLSAVICHHGSAGGGHYTAYCLNYIDHRWYEFDDNTVTLVDQSTVENCEAYILFYKKTPDMMMKIREEVDNLYALQSPQQLQFVKFYLSQEWVNRFNTFSEPGPISNYDFLCPHGLISPDKVPNLNNLYTEIPSQVWKKIYEEFGGGPVCSNLYHCYSCQNEARQLVVRREREKQTFRQLEKDSSSGRPEHHYVISMRWFKEWEKFITDIKYGPPGPIDNTDILVKKNDQFQLRQGCHYAQLQRDMWEFFYTAYGGGPEIIYNPASPYVPMVNLTPQIQQADSNESSSSVEMPISAAKVVSPPDVPAETQEFPAAMEASSDVTTPPQDVVSMELDN